jgi:hypothetical protein
VARGRSSRAVPSKQAPAAIKKGKAPKSKRQPPAEEDEASSQDEQEMPEEEPTVTEDSPPTRGTPYSYSLIALEGVKAPVMTIRTRRVAKSVTRKRWSVLSPESRTQAIAILRDIQRCFPTRSHYLLSRPVLMAIKNENRRTTAQALIEHTINRIETQLEKIPLPIGSKDRHFNFERIINENVNTSSYVDVG